MPVTMNTPGFENRLAQLELDFRTPGACELAFFGVTPALVGRGFL